MVAETETYEDVDSTGGGGYFTAAQIEMLNAPLDRKSLKTKQNNLYIEGFVAIRNANRIFGYGGWSHTVDDRWTITTDEGQVMYCATVTVTAISPVNGLQSQHQDVGSSIAALNKSSGKISIDSHETAMKGAVTDALKRALRAYGEQFANGLYDKSYLAERDAQERVQREESEKRDKYSKAVLALEEDKLETGHEVEMRKQFVASLGQPYISGINNWSSELLIEYGRLLRGLASKEKVAS